MKKLNYLLILAIIGLSFSGCFKDDVDINIEKLTEIDVPIEIGALPIATIELNAEDLLGRLSDSVKDFIQVEDDGLLCIKYKDSLVSVWDEVVELEEVSYDYNYSVSDLLSKKKAAVNRQEKIVINTSSDQRLDSMIIQSSEIVVELNVPEGLTGNAVITIPELTLNDDPLSFTFDLSETGIRSQSQDLAGNRIDFSHSSNADSSFFRMVISGNVEPADILNPPDPSAELGARISLTSLVPEVLFGFFGQITVMDKVETFEYTFYSDLEVEGMIEFYDFQILAEFDNYFGLPFNGTLANATVDNTEDAEPPLEIEFLTNNTVYVEPATYSSNLEPTRNTFEVNRSNSNILSAINMFPNSLEYNMQVNINPNSTDEVNFVTQKNQITGNIYTIIPLWLRTSAYFRTDTVHNFDVFSNLEDDQLKYMKSTTLAMSFQNFFPFELQAQIYFTDENYSIIDSLFDSGKDFLVNGELNDEDIIVSPGASDVLIELSKEKIELYRDAGVTSLILGTSTSTADDGVPFVKIIDSYGFELKIAMAVEGDEIDF